MDWRTAHHHTGGELRAGLLYDGRTQLCHLPSPVELATARVLARDFTLRMLNVSKRRFVDQHGPMPTCPLQRAKGARCQDGWNDRWNRVRTGMFPAAEQMNESRRMDE